MSDETVTGRLTVAELDPADSGTTEPMLEVDVRFGGYMRMGVAEVADLHKWLGDWLARQGQI